MKIDDYEITLLDDGTLDTVIEVSHPNFVNGSEEMHFDGEFASEWRDDTGLLDLKGFAEDVVIPDCEGSDFGQWKE